MEMRSIPQQRTNVANYDYLKEEMGIGFSCSSQKNKKESGVNLTLTIVDTPGFGDAVDNSNCWDPVVIYSASS